ncbi:hypothetical protein DPMN_085589 [Dreissena polymorpha]|uniref:Uncharacterized protein n=1 Tax=Dreissena polymorpha TaxID=45954 RepID=A0A9D3YCZ9_DREPO|nr:hypothetical protein DPMN_085589 [Dreissena polymorpha]
MVIVRRWIVVALPSRKRDGSSGDGSLEDGRCGYWAETQARISRKWPNEDNGSAPERRYLVRSTFWRNCSGDRVDGLWRIERPYKRRSARGAGSCCFFLIFSTTLVE